VIAGRETLSVPETMHQPVSSTGCRGIHPFGGNHNIVLTLFTRLVYWTTQAYALRLGNSA